MPVPLIAAVAKAAAPMLKKAAVKAGKKMAVNAARKAMSKKEEEKQRAKKGMKVRKYKKGGKKRKYQNGGDVKMDDPLGAGDALDAEAGIMNKGEKTDTADAVVDAADDVKVKAGGADKKKFKDTKFASIVRKQRAAYDKREQSSPAQQRAKQGMMSYKKGGKLAKQAAIAIAMKKAGKKPKSMKEGGKVAPMKKKKAGMTHSDGSRRVPNYKKGASDVRKEFKTAYDREQHRLGKAGNPKLAQELKKGGKFPDLTGDGKVTQADILKGRGVFKHGGKHPKVVAQGADRADVRGDRKAARINKRTKRKIMRSAKAGAKGAVKAVRQLKKKK